MMICPEATVINADIGSFLVGPINRHISMCIVCVCPPGVFLVIVESEKSVQLVEVVLPLMPCAT